MLQLSTREPELARIVASRDDPLLVHEAGGPVIALAYNWRDERLGFCVRGDPWVHELRNDNREHVLRAGFSASTLIRYDCEGRILGGTRVALARMLEDGTRGEIIASAYKAQPFEDVRGIAAHSSGMIHCSDARIAGKPARIYLINGESKDIVSVSEALPGAGSLCYSPDERHLYVCDPRSSRIMRLSILSSGELQSRCLFAEVGGGAHADGELVVDSLGQLFWGCDEGVHVFDRGGKHLGTVSTDKACASVCFAGRDLRTLLIAEHNRIWSLRVATPGARPVT